MAGAFVGIRTGARSAARAEIGIGLSGMVDSNARASFLIPELLYVGPPPERWNEEPDFFVGTLQDGRLAALLE